MLCVYLLVLTGVHNLPPQKFNNHSFIHSFNKCLLIIYNMLRTDSEVNIRGGTTIMINDYVNLYNY